MEIRTEDLRIGNFIMHGTGSIYTVLGVTSDGMVEYCDGHFDLVETFEGVELTEDWLIKLGFTKDGFNGYSLNINYFKELDRELYFSGDYLYVREDFNTKTISPHDKDLICLWNKDLRKIFYVHELQNLYHSITGKNIPILVGS